MTNFILSILGIVLLAITSLSLSEPEINEKNQLSEEQQIEIYERAMDSIYE